MGRLCFFFIFLIPLLGVSRPGQTQSLFTLLSPKDTKVSFVNKIEENDSLHIFRYEYLYNGNGIGIGDFNNDGSPDLFISGNTVANKLYLNKSLNGKITFEDISKKSKIEGNGTWSTGVSVADVNGDGLLDIYVCHSGFFRKLSDRNNELFINQGIKNGVPVFKEMAVEAGLNAIGSQSTQAAFFDYDKDGDLDMFLLNHSNHTVNPFLNTREMRATPNPYYGNRLFENISENGKLKFKDVTQKAGIINNALNFGLSVIVADINQDGWPDLYTTSDYTEVDCYYVNNKNGTFTESLKKSFTHVSKFSMGADVSDFNNDGKPDVLTLDMLPEDNHRQKLLKGPDVYDQYHLLLDSGYYHQNMRNMLHLNRGTDAEGNVRFSEIGQMSGVSNTDWSWAGLMADLDNDGWKDLLITNGYLRDFTNMDFLKYTVADEQMKEVGKGNLNFKTYSLVQKMPSNKLKNYLFQNTADASKQFAFEDVSEKWGFNEDAVSNAAAYADFDGDGDLDIVISNMNEAVSIYQNNGEQKSLTIKLKGLGKNTQAFGSKVWVYANGIKQYAELYPVRGYQATVTSALHFGLGKASKVDSVRVVWPSGKVTMLANSTEKILILKEEEAGEVNKSETASVNTTFQKIPAQSIGIDFVHNENEFVDFKVEVLLPYQLSKLGPALAKADVNGDGLEDLFFGGASNQFGVLYLQKPDGKFEGANAQPWRQNVACEEVNALFFDADKDGDQDLYVVSGGNEFEDQAPEYRDHLYINDGKGNFHEEVLALPSMKNPKQCAVSADMDGDGDMDIFVGGRAVPGSFPMAARSYVLRNDSQGNTIKFTDATADWSKDLLNPGMVTGAVFADLDQDKKPDLMLIGDWMAVKVFRNTGNAFTEQLPAELSDTDGMWAALMPVDLDKDGDMDFVLGNGGLNNQYKASAEQPVTIYYDDFDKNGVVDPVCTYFIGDKNYPMFSRDEMLDQIPFLKRKYTNYALYADATLTDILGQEAVEKSKKVYCKQLSSIVLENKGDFKFQIHDLPEEAQISRVSAIVPLEMDGNNRTGLLLAGNFSCYRVQLGPCDASVGVALRQVAPFRFVTVSPAESGFWAGGEIRSGVRLNNSRIVIGVNGGDPLIFEQTGQK
ncbi:VCBS repeat-containing protein [Dyadobacter fanqingshengii]|uniref:VCBS repeat-containing protein n=1 Tax=Dyadobacter fanqingshengii TaxID=2906443 RepID=A0A9X1P6M3_9BACT|nr:VCBS repeat-containing protein [Dyadobacter fanqingshengii]MCF0038654.1 VCBS repeat-containing protein [Dyadobacter fanqingshengii]USJ34513.1 VCBS repeat-containing protein [Dyadobacter fanqingshengii]